MALKINKKTTGAELVKAMADGEMEAFAEIYNRWSPVLRRFVTGLIKNRVKAEDIVQNIFMKMMSTRPVFDNEPP